MSLNEGVPPSHTRFSWLHGIASPVGGGEADGGGQQQPPAPQRAPQPQAHPQPASALLWLHGLGDTGNGWRGKFKLFVPGK